MALDYGNRTAATCMIRSPLPDGNEQQSIIGAAKVIIDSGKILENLHGRFMELQQERKYHLETLAKAKDILLKECNQVEAVLNGNEENPIRFDIPQDP